MKMLLGMALGLIAVAGAGRYIASGRLFERMEAAMERCPPIQRMRRLEQQNDEVISLLREQNTLLRESRPAAVATPV